MKSISASWSLVAGLLSVLGQMILYLVRFGRWNTGSTLAVYLYFFLAGTLGGLILIFMLNRQTSLKARRIVLAAFLLASPLALLLMLGGGLLGPLGLLILPQIPWALFTWLGSLLGRFISRGRDNQTQIPRRHQ